MLNFDDYDSGANRSGESRRAEQTDRVNGEYHYKNGYTQKIYSDAHYILEDESTAPPRYYTPPKKQAKEAKECREKDSAQSGMGAKLALLCIACAIAGGVVGAGIVSSQLSDKVSKLENYIDEINDNMLEAQKQHELIAAAAESEAVSPAEIYEEACAQVVSIKTEAIYTSFFGRQISSTGSGSGFVVTEDGYIVTNYHVIEAAYESDSSVNVELKDGTVYEAAVVGSDAGSDIAVLKIEASGLVPAKIGDSDKISVGDRIFAVGNPLTWLEFSMTTGHVCALNREIKAGDMQDGINMFQIDAPVNSGNSGGPVYNERGEVIGIVTAKYSESGVEGIGFAIPISDAYPKVNDIITKGYLTGRAAISLSVDARYNAMYSQYYRMPLGAYVASVDENGCAHKAGIQPGDIITKVGDYTVSGYNDLASALKYFSAGEETDVEVYRNGDTVKLAVCFDEARSKK